MSMKVGTPVNQVRHTNVAIVRLSKKGKKFEIACYPNKVLSWRNKSESDINEVLQIDTVFVNVTQGMLANKKDMEKCFNTTDQRMICQQILSDGELQISEQERESIHEIMFRDVAAIVVDKSVNPENNRPYTLSMIQNAMKQIHFSVNTTKGAKAQALDVLRKLKSVMPIARAKMRVRIGCPLEDKADVQGVMWEQLDVDVGLGRTMHGSGVNSVVPSATEAGEVQRAAMYTFDFHLDPELYRAVQRALIEITDDGFVEVLQLNACTGTAIDTASSAGAHTLHDTSGAAEAAAPEVPTKTSSSIATPDAFAAESIFRMSTSDAAKAKGNGKNQNKKQSKLAKRQERERMEDIERYATETKERAARNKQKEEEENKARLAQEKNAGSKPEEAGDAELVEMKTKKCNTCGGAFNAAEYRKHFQSEWHRFNLKLKMKEMPVMVSEDAFLALTTAEMGAMSI